MRTIDYDTTHEEETGNTETLIATDEKMHKKYGNLQHAYEEGFAASHGVRSETAETNGAVKHPETADESHGSRTATSIGRENPGLSGS